MFAPSYKRSISRRTSWRFLASHARRPYGRHQADIKSFVTYMLVRPSVCNLEVLLLYRLCGSPGSFHFGTQTEHRCFSQIEGNGKLAVLADNLAVFLKWAKIRPSLLLITNEKLHIGLRTFIGLNELQ